MRNRPNQTLQDTAAAMLRQVCAALAEAHARGLTHRDADSPNWVTPSGRTVQAWNTTGTECQLWLLSLLGVE